MNTEKLCRKLTHIGVCLGGHFKVVISYRKRLYSITSTNTTALDRFNLKDVPERESRYGYTLKQALLAMYNEVKRHHGLK